MTKKTSENKPSSYRFSDETKELLAKIAEAENRSATNMLEVLILQEAKKRGLIK